MRLQRRGHKGYAFYSIVIADSRAPRDGRFIEKVGTYNPNTHPSTVDLDFDRALYWLNVGAQPTDTVRNILSHEGVLLMKHLQGGVKKGAFTEEEAQTKFNAWKTEREAKLAAIAGKDGAAKAEARKAQLEQEKKQNEEKRKQVAEKRAQIEAEKAAAAAAEAAEAETEAPAAEEAPATESAES